MFSLTRFCPMYSSSLRGRTLTSMRASSSYAAPDRIRSGCLCCIIRFALASAILLCVPQRSLRYLFSQLLFLTPPAPRVLSARSGIAAPRATASQNSLRLPRVSLPPPPLQLCACRSPTPPALKPRPLPRPPQKPPRASPFRWPQLRACLSARPQCVPRSFFLRREFSSSAPGRRRESQAPTLPPSFRKGSSVPETDQLRKRKSAAQKNVFRAPTRSQKAPAHLRARGCESAG